MTWTLKNEARKSILILVIPQRHWHNSVTFLDYMKKLFHSKSKEIQNKINTIAIDILIPIKIN